MVRRSYNFVSMRLTAGKLVIDVDIERSVTDLVPDPDGFHHQAF